MANPLWRAPRIHGELKMLGINESVKDGRFGLFEVGKRQDPLGRPLLLTRFRPIAAAAARKIQFSLDFEF